jgi:hypothetical protein
MSKWNYRVFRCASEPDGSPFYEMREVHYDEADKVTGWTEGASSPMGTTFRELIADFGWYLSALGKPILDDKTGLECEPAQMLADDLQQWLDARADAKGEA